jgi:O-antigen ligase
VKSSASTDRKVEDPGVEHRRVKVRRVKTEDHTGEDRKVMTAPPTPMSKQKPAFESALLYSTFGLLMFGPLAFGAVEPWSIFVLETGAAVLTIAWLYLQLRRGEIKIFGNPLFLPMGVFGLLILTQIVFHVTAYRHDSMSGAFLYCAYGMLAFLTVQTLRRGSQARWLAVILSVYGAGMAMFALLQGISPNGKLYWVRQPRLGGWIYGPYVNHNHYAGLMEMLVPIPLVIAASRLATTKERVAAGAAAVLMASTIFLSSSRGGMLAFVAELIVLAVVMIRQRQGLRAAVGIGGFLVIVLALLVWLGGSQLHERVTSIGTETRTELSGGMRLSIDRDGLRMFAKKPVLGWGLRSFPIIYPQFRSFYTNFFVNEAHDDYLQLLVEMGALGFATMIWFLVVLFRAAIKKLDNWTGEISGASALACLLGLTGILVHGWVDFNLQIPANAAFFYALCSIAASDAFPQASRKRKMIRPQVQQELPASEVV